MTFQKFAHKIAIVTGAASGLGLAISNLLIDFGCKVIAIDKDRVSLESVARKLGNKVEGRIADVTDFDSMSKIVNETIERHGRLNYFFNNAAIAILGEVQDITIEDWNQVISVNLNGVVNGIAAAYPVMVKQKFGHIVNISSLTGITPAVMLIPYTTSKFGIVGLSHSLRMEAKYQGIKVSVACPNLINTPLWTNSRVVKSQARSPKDLLELFKPLPKLVCANKVAKTILKGVVRNKATILTDFYSRALWWGYRMSPTLWMWGYDLLVAKKFRSLRKEN
jgi:NAD(P)-dependent dehydrogenase (short-subunit alcohol dehydrogenase family)